MAPRYPFFSFSGSKLVDSSLIFKDGHFEDVSEVRKAYCWKYFLYANVKPNQKAKCRVEMSKGEYCNKVLSVSGGTTSTLNNHLKHVHGINELSSFLGLDSNL